jgi:hypothetical protein
LFAAGSAAVHELRYLIGYGGGASRALAAHPHGYFSVALPGVITATLITLAAALMRAAGARGPATRQVRIGFAGFWLACAVLLAAIYGIQETLEGAGAFAGGGWLGFALAIPVGLLVALALRGADVAEELRAPGAALRIFFAAAVARGARPLLAARRTAVARIRARGPPLAFVV